MSHLLSLRFRSLFTAVSACFLTVFVLNSLLINGFKIDALNSFTSSASTPATSTSAPVAPAAKPLTDAEKINAKLSALGAKYGISISTTAPAKKAGMDASWQPISQNDQEALSKFAGYLGDELDVYSSDIFARVQLRSIYIVKDLKIDGQASAGMPDGRFDDALYFDISDQNMQEDFMKSTIHHELSHLIDYNLHGSYYWNDSVWKACNTSGFAYGKGGAAMRDQATYANSVHPKAGFITGYATSGIEEDKAEVYAELMTGRYGISNKAATDSNLACKTELMRTQMTQLGLNL